MIDGDTIRDTLEALRTSFLGSIGGAVSFLYSMSEKEMSFTFLAFILYMVLGSVAAEFVNSIVLPDTFVNGRAIVLFFSGTLGFVGFGIARRRGQEWIKNYKLGNTNSSIADVPNDERDS